MPAKKVKEPDDTPVTESEEEEPVEGHPDDGSAPGDDEEIDLDALIEEKVKASMAKVGGGGKQEVGASPESLPAPEGERQPEPPRNSPAGPPTDVEAAVRKIMDEREHAEAHHRMDNPTPKPPEPRPGYLARALFGKHRKG